MRESIRGHCLPMSDIVACAEPLSGALTAMPDNSQSNPSNARVGFGE